LLPRTRAKRSSLPTKPTFRELAHAWLAHLETVEDAKPSTLIDYRVMLKEPDVPYQRGTGRTLGRIMRPLGDLAAADVTREDIDALLTELDKQPISRRTVNKHRATLHAIFNFSRFPDQRARWGVEQNPVTDTRKRRQEDPGHLEVFTVEQIEALARAAENGIWRSERTYIAFNTEHLRRHENHELAELLRVAAYTGFRIGELVTLRWEDVSWAERVLSCAAHSRAPRSDQPRAAASATSRSPTRPPPRSTDSAGGQTSPALATTYSRRSPANGLILPPFGVATKLAAMPPSCRRFASMTSDTRRAVCWSGSSIP